LKSITTFLISINNRKTSLKICPNKSKMISIGMRLKARRINLKNMKVKIYNLLIRLITKFYFLQKKIQSKNKTIEVAI
jgi:hypothetical protein